MKKIYLVLLLISVSFAQEAVNPKQPVADKKYYKVTIYQPEKKTYNNVADLKYDTYYRKSSGQIHSSRIIEFFEQPNGRHIIIGDGWIAEENFK